MFFRKSPPSSLSPEQILAALRSVQDPDLHRDIVSLGFVKNLTQKSGKVSFEVELTTPACPVKDQLKAQCESVVGALPGVTQVEVKMTANVRPGSGSAPGKISLPGVKNVIAVASGKGGVGKSTVTINLAVALAQTGARVGLLDADIYGPSIPLMMGAKERPPMKGERVLPVERAGIKLMSMGFMIPDDQAVVWRGPMVHGALTQFMSQVEWGDLDYLLIDMPPGTGDAQLTISQAAPLSGALIVTTPQDVSLLDARRGTLMFRNVNIPILGIIENMAGYTCGHCGENTPIFRKGGGARIAAEMGVPLLGSLPIDPRVADGGDLGTPIASALKDSPVAKLFAEIAGKVASSLAVMGVQGSSSFKPVSLEWQS